MSHIAKHVIKLLNSYHKKLITLVLVHKSVLRDVPKNMATKLVEAFSAINGIVINPIQISSVDEDRFNINRSESERRIFFGCVFIVILFGFWTTFFIIILATLENKPLGIRERYYDGMANSKLYVVYTRGHTAMMEFQKNLKLKVTRKRQLEYDMCSYFGFYDYPYLNIFPGSNRNTGQIDTKNSALKVIGREMPQLGAFYFEVDSSYVISSSYFWVIGTYNSIIETTCKII